MLIKYSSFSLKAISFLAISLLILPKVYSQRSLLRAVSTQVLSDVYKGIEGFENPSRPPTLLEIFHRYNRTSGFHKYLEYFNMYEPYVSPLRRNALLKNNNLNMLEIGVQNGGSIEIWSIYFGNLLRYTGVDRNPKCLRFDDPSRHVKISIGDQTNVTFLNELCDLYGPFDLIVDDGAHTAVTIMTSLFELWKCMKHRGVYAIEDLHTTVRYAMIYSVRTLMLC